MKFLVVDDSATMRRILVNSLQRIGYSEFVEAVDGRDALDKCDASIGFVITDSHMPNVSGPALARDIRDAGLGVPILMVTTRSVREEVATALEAGVNDYIVKPFTPQLLKEKIDAVLAGSGASV